MRLIKKEATYIEGCSTKIRLVGVEMREDALYFILVILMREIMQDKEEKKKRRNWRPFVQSIYDQWIILNT